MQLIIFEDELTHNFTPLTLTKPAFDLTSGTSTILQNLKVSLKLEDYALIVQPHLAETTEKRHRCRANPDKAEGETVFINGLLNPSEEAAKLLKRGKNFIALSNSQMALAKLGGRQSEIFAQNLRRGSSRPPKAVLNSAERFDLPDSALTRYPWEPVLKNPDVIARQAGFIKGVEAPDLSRCEILGPASNLILEEDVKVEPYVTFDVRVGPVIVGGGAEVQSFSRISGPCYIGRHAQIRSALIGGGSTIGDHCKVGGEVDCSIISPYSNKAHVGFVGHSYIGEWVNIGAQTTTSDLKNTYGTVKISIGERRVDTESIKIGSLIADHAKASIGCQIYSGVRVGVASHIHGYVTEDVPSFTIYAKSLSGKAVELRLESALETQKRMMQRRSRRPTQPEVKLLTKVFEMTQDERYRCGVTKATFKL